jgi:uncharacterized protein with PIN domain
MKFILDGMLGKLSRWLRMMGHDTNYSTTLDDLLLLKIAKNEKRVLLTRDFALYQQAITKHLEAYYVEGIDEPQRLSELAHRFNLPLSIDLEKSRCPKCNTKLQPVSKEKIANRTEQNTLKYYDVFWECPTCTAVYWQGAHWTKIRAILEQAKEIQKEKKAKV